jgi:hypothetical protein
MKRVTLTDVYDENGDMLRIEAFDLEGEFVLQAVWDPKDEQTSENREEFRKWFYRILKQKEYQL